VAAGPGAEAENANIFSTNAGQLFKKAADYLIRRFDASFTCWGRHEG
jgi:hypothetical protein